MKMKTEYQIENKELRNCGAYNQGLAKISGSLTRQAQKIKEQFNQRTLKGGYFNEIGVST